MNIGRNHFLVERFNRVLKSQEKLIQRILATMRRDIVWYVYRISIEGGRRYL